MLRLHTPACLYPSGHAYIGFQSPRTRKGHSESQIFTIWFSYGMAIPEGLISIRPFFFSPDASYPCLRFASVFFVLTNTMLGG
jgi:hypothetical protein